MRDHSTPKQIPGHLTIACAKDDPLVLMRVPAKGDILFTPEQARNVARLLIERANEIENRKDSLEVEMKYHG